MNKSSGVGEREDSPGRRNNLCKMSRYVPSFISSSSSYAYHTTPHFFFFLAVATISHPQSLMPLPLGKGLEFHNTYLLTLLALRFGSLGERSFCDSTADPDLVSYFEHLEETVVGHPFSSQHTYLLETLGTCCRVNNPWEGSSAYCQFKKSILREN